MEITIIKKNQLTVFNLPKNVVGSFWINSFDNGKKRNILNVEADNGAWQLISNENIYLVDDKDVMIPSVTLKDYSFYLIKDVVRNEKYYLYTSPVYENENVEIAFSEKDQILVGSGDRCDISYSMSGIPSEALAIIRNENGFYLQLKSKDLACYLNKNRVFLDCKLNYGDILFLYGLKIILMKKKGVNYLLVNNPGRLLKYNASMVQAVPIENNFVDDYAVLNNDDGSTKEFFYRAPHFYREFEDYSVKIDSPPAKKDNQSTPMVLTIGPMITMSMTSVMMLLSQFQAIASGEKDFASSMTGMITAGVMLASCLLWPLLTRLYQKFSAKRYEAKRQKQYKKYLDRKEEEIDKELEKQKSALIDNYFSVNRCQEVISKHELLLWQRRITDKDFLTMPVGIGNLPMKLSIGYPEEHFSLEEDNLLDMVHHLGSKKRILMDVPVTYSFYENFITGIVGDSAATKRFMDNLVLQMMTNYSYDELKFVTFTSVDRVSSWDYIKTLPHSWSNDHSFRFFGSSNDDYREMIYLLEKIFQERKNVKGSSKMPHYVIITDAIKSIDSYDFIKNVLATEENVGFSIIMLVDRISALPNECKNFIEVSFNKCNIFQSQLNQVAQEFKLDMGNIDNIYACAEELANIPIDIKTEVESNLVDSLQFLEMYQVGKVNQLNSLERWKKSNPVLSLQAPVGIGKNGEVITLDLHEKFHGPHGLIAGTTGSGKSEFIITFVLSLAVNYHPYEVQMILIDYKGGSLAGAFVNDKYRLPHIAGTITNLDGNELNRSLASIESEVKRRQKEFNDAKAITNESTMDIYKYQKLWREGKLKEKEPIAHLFIISDEFAELKEQQPEFMEKLISVARVGRSLGVHLILATQKPGGVVNAQIWSNSRFKVCLKVQDTGDSQEVLRKPDAAYLKKTGRFYLQVGYDEVYTLGQSAWTGGQYFPSTTFKKEMDTSVNTINNIAYVISSKDSELKEETKSAGEELPNIVHYLSDIAAQEHIQVKKLWLDKMPAFIYLDKLKEKYQYQREYFHLNPIIGEYDNPSAQNQYLLTVPMSEQGNVLVYGIAGSGKEQFISSLIFSCMTNYAPEEVNFYVIDFGAETLKMYENSPYVGDIVLLSDQEKLTQLFKMIDTEFNERRKLFSSYGGNYLSYIKTSKQYMPNIVIAINGWEAFSENYDEYVDKINQFSRDAYKYGIFFCITAVSASSIRIKTRQNFSLVYVLEQSDESEFSSILGNCRGKIPARMKGRGLFKKDAIYEFQTASITSEEDVSSYVKKYCNYLNERVKYHAKKIPILPEVVDYAEIHKHQKAENEIAVGISKNELNLETFSIQKEVCSVIASYDYEEIVGFVSSIGEQLDELHSYDFMLINALDVSFDEVSYSKRIYSSQFSVIIDKMHQYLKDAFEQYQNNQFNLDSIASHKKIACMIYGLHSFISKLDSETKKKWEELFELNRDIHLISFIFVDSPDNIKKYAFEPWMKDNFDGNRGVFVGNGISEQMLFKISKLNREDREEIGLDSGFIIRSSKAISIKLVNSYRKNS